MATLLPKALFDTLEYLSETPSKTISEYLQQIKLANINEDWRISRLFLQSYAGSYDTFNAYRREVERLLQWSWLIAKKTLPQLDRNDLRNYLDFVMKPPLHWVTTKNGDRFIDQNAERIHNPEWRPFSMKLTKLDRKLGKTAHQEDYRLANQSLAAIISIGSTFFTFLQQENYVALNPVQLIRQKNRYVQKQQSHKITRKLSHLQWQTVIDEISKLASMDAKYERHLFILSAFYLLGLRISELAETLGRIPVMGDFAPDKESRWWFTTVGKGNKVRDVAVPDEMLTVLKRYRQSLNLSPLPLRGESTPIIAKERGRGGLGTRQIRNLVQFCFDHAIAALRKLNKEDEAQDLATATVHWLRHTAISADVEHRPREHVRDDAGHQNATITDRYIDTDRRARHESARGKKLRPE